MTEKKSTEKISNLMYATVILAIVAVVNILGFRFFGRLDLTENKLYTISPVTKQILGELDDVVSVKAYFSKKLPVQLGRLPSDVDDLLSEYRIYSHGNISYERLDPADNEELKQKLAQLGIMPVTMTIIEKDEQQQINGYLAITVSYGEMTEAIPVVQNTADLEYDLTSRIYRVTTVPEHVGFVTGFGIHDLNQDYQYFAQEVRKIHELDPVDLSDGRAVPENIKTLVLAGPRDTIPETVRYSIDQFIMRGGRAIFLIDNLEVSQTGQPTIINQNLGGMLLSYGFQLNRDVVQDPKSHSPQRISQGIFSFNRPNPFFPHVIKNQFGEHPIVSRLSEMTLPWTGTVDKVLSPDTSVVYTILASTSDQARTHKPPTFQPSEVPGVKSLVLMGTGRFTSAFKGSPKPAGSADSSAKIDKCVQETSIMVIPSSGFLQNQFLYPGNLEFVLNAIDFMSIGDKLISIRTRPTTDRPLKAISPEMKNFLRIANIVGVPVLVILFGMFRFYLKRRDKAVRSRAI